MRSSFFLAICLSTVISSFSMETDTKTRIYSVNSPDGNWRVFKRKLVNKRNRQVQVPLGRKIYQPVVFSPNGHFLMYENKNKLKNKNLVWFDLWTDEAFAFIKKNPEAQPVLKFLTNNLVVVSKIEDDKEQTIALSNLNKGWIRSFTFPKGELLSLETKRMMLLFKNEDGYYLRSFDNKRVEKVSVTITQR